MTRPNARQAIIDHRRRLVAELLLHKLSRRQIVAALAEQDLRNPDSGKPYCLQTIQNDVKALRKKWCEQAARDMDEWVAEHLAELVEVRRAAWEDEDLSIVLRSLKQEAELLGLEAPSKHMIVSPVTIYLPEIDEVPDGEGEAIDKAVARPQAEMAPDPIPSVQVTDG